MRGRESGMPDEATWRGFYAADAVITALECTKNGTGDIVEFGCGYGTFTLPAARRTSGSVHAFDIDPVLVAQLRGKAADAGLANIVATVRDFLAEGTGLPDAGMDHAMVYNILHVEDPVGLLREAYRVLKPGGAISIMHWKHDPATPRGPSMAIRPRPRQCRAWAEQAGFTFVRHAEMAACSPYHYGMLLVRPAA